MNVEQYNGYWIATDVYLQQQKRDANARLIWDYLITLGWTPEAVAGILGNMDVESTMNSALIEGRNIHTLIDNNTCLAINNSTGVGLVQWTGHTPTAPAGQKLASFAIRYNKNWYDGELQCFRLERECAEDLQFQAGTVDGVYYDWQTYIASTETPEQLAKVWQYQYESGGTDTATRQAKARYYFTKMQSKFKPWWFAFLKKKELKPRCITM